MKWKRIKKNCASWHPELSALPLERRELFYEIAGCVPFAVFVQEHGDRLGAVLFCFRTRC